jgi:hypothetical protein
VDNNYLSELVNNTGASSIPTRLENNNSTGSLQSNSISSLPTKLVNSFKELSEALQGSIIHETDTFVSIASFPLKIIIKITKTILDSNKVAKPISYLSKMSNKLPNNTNDSMQKTGILF